MTNTMVLRSNLVMPTIGYELDREEMTYVDGGADVYEGARECVVGLSKILGCSVAWLLTSCGIAGGAALTSPAIFTVILGAVGVLATLSFSFHNFAQFTLALGYSIMYGGFQVESKGFFWWNLDFVKKI